MNTEKRIKDGSMGLGIVLAFGVASALLAIFTAVTLIRNMGLGDGIPPAAWLALGMAAGCCLLLVLASVMMVINQIADVEELS